MNRPAAINIKTRKDAVLKNLQVIPGVGKSISLDLYNLGIRSVRDLVGRDPEVLYDESNAKAGTIQDPCLLYVFRCAIYFAETKAPEKEKLKWWNWKEIAVDR